jgi:putative flippase GtrA
VRLADTECLVLTLQVEKNIVQLQLKKIDNWLTSVCSFFKIDAQFIKFLIVGGINTLFGYLIFAFFIFINVHYSLAALISTIAGIIFNFNTTGRLVFKNRNNRLIFRFFGVYLIIYSLNILFLKLFDSMQISMFIAGAVIILPMAVIAFLLNKYLVFN